MTFSPSTTITILLTVDIVKRKSQEFCLHYLLKLFHSERHFEVFIFFLVYIVFQFCNKIFKRENYNEMKLDFRQNRVQTIGPMSLRTLQCIKVAVRIYFSAKKLDLVK